MQVSSHYNFVVAVWGEEFRRTFHDYALPTLLAPDNLPAFTSSHSSSFELYTTEADALWLSDTPVIRRLVDVLPVRFHTHDDLISEDQYGAVSAFHRFAIRAAAKTNDALVFLTPDQMWADGSLAELGELADAGLRVVMVPSLRVVKESFAPAMRQRFGVESGGVIAANPDAFVSVGLKHLHQITRHTFAESESFSAHPSHVIWRVAPDRLLVRSFHLHPLMVHPRNVDADFEITVDDDFIYRACPDRADYHIVPDSSKISVFEMTEAERAIGLVRTRSATPEFVAGWAELYAHKLHRDFFATTTFVGNMQTAESNHETVQAAEEFYGTVNDLLALPTERLVARNFSGAVFRAMRKLLRRRLPPGSDRREGIVGGICLGMVGVFAILRIIVIRVWHRLAQFIYRHEERLLSIFDPGADAARMSPHPPGRRICAILYRKLRRSPRSLPSLLTGAVRAINHLLSGEPPALRPWSLHWLRLRPFYRNLLRIVSRYPGPSLHAGYTGGPCRLCFPAARGASVVSLDFSFREDVEVVVQPNQPWPFASEEFPTIVVTDAGDSTMDHFRWIASEAQRVLTPDGRLIVYMPGYADGGGDAACDNPGAVLACRFGREFDFVEIEQCGGQYSRRVAAFAASIRRAALSSIMWQLLIVPLAPLLLVLILGLNLAAGFLDRFRNAADQSGWIFAVAVKKHMPDPVETGGRTEGDLTIRAGAMLWGQSYAGLHECDAFLRRAGANPAAVVRLPAERHRLATQMQDQEIVVADVEGRNAGAGFAEHAMKLDASLSGRARFRHPAFAGKLSDVDFTGRVYLNGFPGAGNSLLGTILNRVLAARARVPLEESADYLSRMCRDYEESVHALLRTSINDHLPFEEAVQPVDTHSTNITFHRDGSFIDVIYPSRAGYIDDLFGAHEPPSDQVFAQHLAQKRRIFVALRHPLDMVVSNANKVANQHPATLLNHLPWFRSMAETVAVYLRQYAKWRDSIEFVRYEDLIHAPDETIVEIASGLGFEAPMRWRRDLWDEIGFRPLDTVGDAHLWRPGAGKWREFLSGSHREILESLGYEELLEDFGYAPDLPDGADTATMLSPRDIEKFALPIADFRYGFFYGKPAVFGPSEHPAFDFCSFTSCGPRGVVRTFSNDRDLLDRFLVRANDAEFQLLMGALGE